MGQPVQIPIACLPTPRASATRRFKNRMEALALTTRLFGSPIRAEQPQEVIRWFEPVTFCRFRDTVCLQPVSPCLSLCKSQNDALPTQFFLPMQ